MLKKVDPDSYTHVCNYRDSTHNRALLRARAALHPKHGHYLPLDSPAEQPSTLEFARSNAHGAVSNCDNILMEEEERAMSPQVLSIIADNTSTSSWSASLAPSSARWDPDAWRAAMSATLGYCPPWP